jgi:hypothetical protein
VLLLSHPMVVSGSALRSFSPLVDSTSSQIMKEQALTRTISTTLLATSSWAGSSSPLFSCCARSAQQSCSSCCSSPSTWPSYSWVFLALVPATLESQIGPHKRLVDILASLLHSWLGIMLSLVLRMTGTFLPCLLLSCGLPNLAYFPPTIFATLFSRTNYLRSTANVYLLQQLLLCHPSLPLPLVRQGPRAESRLQDRARDRLDFLRSSLVFIFGMVFARIRTIYQD